MEPAKNLPARASEAPIHLAPFLLTTMSWPAAFELMVFLVNQSKDQTSLTLERSYRVNLRRDIKDRRIAGASLTPSRATDSLSIRCLHICCFLARQMHVARERWIIVSSSSSNNWSCPSVLHLVTLSNTWVMTTDLCGYGETWRKHTRLLMRSGLTQEIYIALKKTLLHNKRLQLFLLAFEAFFTLPTHPVFHVPSTVCRRFGFRAFHQCKRTALLQSIGILVWAVWCSEQSVPAVSNCTHEGGHLTSHLASALSKQDVQTVSRQLFSLSHTAKRFPSPSTTYTVTYNTSFSQSGICFLTTSRFTVVGYLNPVSFSKLW